MDLISKLLNIPKVHPTNEPLVQPLYQTSLFQMPSYEEALQCEHATHPRAYYTRWGNPTVSYLENQLLSMMGYEKCLIFPSGMSAITTTFLSLVQAGDHLFVSNRLYGDTLKFIIEELPRLGVSFSFFDLNQLEHFDFNLSEHNNTLIYFETLSNPELVIADLETIEKIAKQLNALTICDATFTPPFNLKIQLSEYVDIAIHSLTKYISGHFSSMGGAVLCSDHLEKKIWQTQSLYGSCIDPQAAWQISQGLKTLALRLKAQNSSAYSIAQHLSQHPQVKTVCYPFLTSNSQWLLAQQLLQGGGGVITFSLVGDKKNAIKLIESTKLIGLFVSLGGVHSCIEHAESMSHSMVNSHHKQETAMVENFEHLIRLSVGIESTADIIADLDQALLKANTEGLYFE